VRLEFPGLRCSVGAPTNCSARMPGLKYQHFLKAEVNLGI